MKALSVKQPYCDLILQGIKTLEIRSRPTKFRGDLLICSSKKLHKGGRLIFDTSIWDLNFWWGGGGRNRHYIFQEINPFGQAFCIVALVNCNPFLERDCVKACVDFIPNHYAYELQNVRPVNPFPVRGQLSFFNISDELISFPA